ncbi:MAG: ice-binding family protein [Bacteroidota bacterium]|nr:ice-binding family protein [Bacteroidota bacterium]
MKKNLKFIQTDTQGSNTFSYLKPSGIIYSLMLLVFAFTTGCNKNNLNPATNTASSSNLAIGAAGRDINAAPINLGGAGNFTILAKSGISTTGTTTIAGDIGVSPISAAAITGFGLKMDTSNQFSLTPIVNGKVYAANYATPTPSKLTIAVSDMETAFTTANALPSPPSNVDIYAGDISGKTLAPGVYKWRTGVLISDAGVTLNGTADDVWVFQIAQNLTVNNAAVITLTGGAQAKNIFWVVSGNATLGTTVKFSGIILSKTLISLNTGARVTGKLLAQTAVTLIADCVHP